jgi:short-subunit dehydrogenase
LSNLKNKYGQTALIAGASEGLGAAFATALASHGFDLVLVARRIEPLEQLASKLLATYNIKIKTITCDLADKNATEQILAQLENIEIDFLVYNACMSYIGPYLKSSIEDQIKIVDVNINTPMRMLHAFGSKMTQRKRGAVVIMASMAGLQGSGYLSTYGASKAFNKIFAEGIWYEWKNKGVDVIACCAGATATPNYLNTNPKKTSIFEPKAQAPEEVVIECLNKIGKTPSFISGTNNKLATFFMQKLFPRKLAITTMGDTAKKMYDIDDK